jgi:hypothetical protein
MGRSALLAQLVEHLHGKEGVDGSSPSEGFTKAPQIAEFCSHSGQQRPREGALRVRSAVSDEFGSTAASASASIARPRQSWKRSLILEERLIGDELHEHVEPARLIAREWRKLPHAERRAGRGEYLQKVRERWKRRLEPQTTIA